MGILKRLFGKKKPAPQQKEEPKQQKPEESRDVSLDEVKQELNNLETVEEDSSIKEDSVESKTQNESVPSAKKEPTKSKQQTQSKSAQEKASTTTAQSKPQDNPSQTEYHIKKHAKGWQVIAAGAKQAHKVFDYQKEAIDYAKSQGFNYKVFRTDGKPRQQ